MRTRVQRIAILMVAALLGTPPSAPAETGTPPPDVEQTIKQEPRFDGVWVGAASVTLIKELDGYVQLQGKDPGSTWSAKGVIRDNTLIVRGNGVTNEGGNFVYESTMTLANGVIHDAWRAIFSKREDLSGNDDLQKVPIATAQESN